MGSFDKTCYLTNTAINYRDNSEVVHIVIWNKIKDKAKQGIYEFLNFLYIQKSEMDRNKEFLEKEKDINNWLLVNNINNSLENLTDYKMAIWNYNDYWAIKDQEIETDPFNSVELFFHKWAIDYILWKDIQEIPKEDLLIELLSNLTYFRRWLWLDLYLTWQQYTDIQEMKQMIELNNKTNEFLKKRIKKYKEDWFDD